MEGNEREETYPEDAGNFLITRENHFGKLMENHTNNLSHYI